MSQSLAFGVVEKQRGQDKGKDQHESPYSLQHVIRLNFSNAKQATLLADFGAC
jgi:hypothetical protein